MADNYDNKGQYQDPPPAYPATQMPPVNTIQPVVMMPQVYALRDVPAVLECPHCKAHVQTSMQYEAGLLVWVLVIVILLLGGGSLCLCFIPFCIDGCKDVDHYCPNCHVCIGRYKRMG